MTAQVVWVTNLIKELGIRIQGAVLVYCDSKAAIQIVANPVFHERTKHIEIDCHFIREKVHQGLINTIYINTRDASSTIDYVTVFSTIYFIKMEMLYS